MGEEVGSLVPQAQGPLYILDISKGAEKGLGHKGLADFLIFRSRRGWGISEQV